MAFALVGSLPPSLGSNAQRDSHLLDARHRQPPVVAREPPSILEWVSQNFPTAFVHEADCVGDCRSPLFMAAMEGRQDVVEALMLHGCDPEQGWWSDGPVPTKQDEWRSDATPLVVACRYGHTACVRLLLEALEQPRIIGQLGGLHSRALPLAARHGNLDVAELLLEARADINACLDGTPSGPGLHQAAAHGHTDLVRLLVLRGGAAVNGRIGFVTNSSSKGASRAKGWRMTEFGPAKDKGASALLLAVQAGELDAAAELIRLGADTAAVAGKRRRSPLYAAARAGHIAMVDLLLRGGASVNAPCAVDRVSGGGGMRPLCVAGYHGHVGIAQLLIDRGAWVDAAVETALKTLSIRKTEAICRAMTLLLTIMATSEAASVQRSHGLYVAAEEATARMVERHGWDTGRWAAVEALGVMSLLLDRAGAPLPRLSPQTQGRDQHIDDQGNSSGGEYAGSAFEAFGRAAVLESSEHLGMSLQHRPRDGAGPRFNDRWTSDDETGDWPRLLGAALDLLWSCV